MSSSKQQGKIQQLCQEYLADLEEFKNDFKNSIKTFLSCEVKNCLFIKTGNPKVGALRIVQLLKQFKADNNNGEFLKKYLGSKNQTFLSWKQLVEVVETDSVLKFTNLLVCEFPQSIQMRKPGIKVVNEIVNRLNILSQKVIFVMPPTGCLEKYFKKLKTQLFLKIDEFNNKKTFLIDTDRMTIMKIVSQGYVDGVKELLNEDINRSLDSDNSTALHIATKNGHKEVVSILLEVKNSDVNVQTNDGSTALHMAVDNEDIEMIQILLNKGARNLSNKSGETPLQMAHRKGHKDVIDCLVKIVGENTNDPSGQAALHAAVKYKQNDVVKTLLDKGVNANVQTNDGISALHMAINNEDIEMKITLLNKETRILINKSGESPMDMANRNGHKDALDCLLKIVGENTNGPSGQTALHTAVKNKQSEVVNTLLDKGVDVNLQTNDGLTALHMAVDNEDIEMIKTLFNKGARMLLSKSGESPLHMAVRKNYKDVVLVLLEVGVDVNAKGLFGQTSLHQAAHYGHHEIVTTLLEKGATVNAKNNNDTTALHNAVYKNHTKVITTLLNQGALNSRNKSALETPFDIAIKHGYKDVVMLLLSNEYNKKQQCPRGETVLHQAAFYGQVDIVELVLQFEPNSIDAKDNNNETPLYWALRYVADHKNTSVLNTLLENGANVKVKNGNGDTPLHFAIMKCNCDLYEIVKVLIDKGAKVMTGNRDGDSSIQLARKKDCDKTVVNLLKVSRF